MQSADRVRGMTTTEHHHAEHRAAERHATDKRTIAREDLPLADRDAAHLPGHWLLARLGKKVLRPGGLELTLAMLDHADIAGRDVVEFAPGLGRTAAEILRIGPSSYTGVDRSPEAVRIVSDLVGQARLPKGGRCVQADASDTGLPDAYCDVVVGEAMLTMQTDRHKRAIASEAFRILRPGGCYAVHELGLTPEDIPVRDKVVIQRELARSIKVNARPLSTSEWSEVLGTVGFDVDWSDSAPMALLKIRRNIADEGWSGVFTIARNLIRDPEARGRVLAMRKVFMTYERNLRGLAMVACKPLESVDRVIL